MIDILNNGLQYIIIHTYIFKYIHYILCGIQPIFSKKKRMDNIV